MILQNTSNIPEFALSADDTTILYSSIHKLVNELPVTNQELSEISNWLKANKLPINGWQLAKMKKSIPDMSLSWNL